MYGFWENFIDACFLVLGKSGKLLNARGNRICFILEFICLLYWGYIGCKRGLYSQAASVVVSIGICIYGFYRWGSMQK